MDCTNKLKVIFGDVTLGIQGTAKGKPFSYIFSYSIGGLESMVIDGKEWNYRFPRPAFWRALTDNDRGNRFHLRSGMWLAADQFISCVDRSVRIDGKEIPLPIAPENNRYTDEEKAETVSVNFVYETITNPHTNADVCYTIYQEGEIRVSVRFHGKPGLPSLPVFGLRFTFPTAADKYVYEGLSGETYPDRMAGGIPGIYEVEGMPVTPYLAPQDCGMHMDTKWVQIYRTAELSNVRGEKKQQALRFEMDREKFAFSCLPYTPQELENALHQEELPPVRRCVLTIYGAVRGIGGIDSWGADVEEAYHISGEKDIDFSFKIVPVL